MHGAHIHIKYKLKKKEMGSFREEMGNFGGGGDPSALCLESLRMTMRLYVGKGMSQGATSQRLWEGFLTSNRDSHTLNMS